MTRDYDNRLRRLEDAADFNDGDYIFFGWTQNDAGEIVSYQLVPSGRTFTPEAFDRLVEERKSVVFVPMQEPSELLEAAARAYWAVKDACRPSLEDLWAENAAAERGEVSDQPTVDSHMENLPWAGDDTWVAGVTLESSQEDLARLHVWLERQAEPFWDEMKARKQRQYEGGWL